MTAPHEKRPLMFPTFPKRLENEWAGPVLLAVVLIVVVGLAAVPWMRSEMKRQERTFAVALTTLDGVPVRELPAQREAALLKTQNLYRWSATVWIADSEGVFASHAWQATVDAADMRVTEHRLEPVEVEPDPR